jgi:RNA polymerase sigma-70 factor (ECF subfamily)
MDNSLRKEIVTHAVLANTSALKRFAYSLCQDQSEAEDMVAETVVKAFENMHQLKNEGKLKQWLFRILNNVFISNYRKNKRQRKINPAVSRDNADHSLSLYEQIETSDFTDAANPEKNFIAKITKEKIHRAIHELPAEFRITLVLCDVDEFSYAEIAAITQVAIGTVRSRIARARKLLQKQLWLYAQELGIRTVQKEKDHICTCGKEESETTAITMQEYEK